MVDLMATGVVGTGMVQGGMETLVVLMGMDGTEMEVRNCLHI